MTLHEIFFVYIQKLISNIAQ